MNIVTSRDVTEILSELHGNLHAHEVIRLAKQAKNSDTLNAMNADLVSSGLTIRMQLKHGEQRFVIDLDR